jgi:hypothetical protein
VRTNRSKDEKLKKISYFTRKRQVEEIIVQREQKVEGRQKNKEREAL